MRIVIDMQGAQTESRFRGIGRYTTSFVKAVLRNRGQHEIILALNGMMPDTIESIRDEFDGLVPKKNIRVWQAPAPVKEIDHNNQSRRQNAELIREAFLASLQPDIVHVCSLFEGYDDDAVTSIGLFDQKIPVSVTLYDLAPLLNPDQYLKPGTNYSEYYLKKLKSLEKASLLLSISDYSKKEALKHLKIFSGQVINISAAIEDDFKRAHVEEHVERQLRSKFLLNKPFVMYTGGADQRENIPRLIKAYARLPTDVRASRQLLLVGKMSQGERTHLLSEATHAGLRADEVCLTGHVSDVELVQLYNLCDLFVSPPGHEDFGLPALEAMACASPVIAANSSSQPEVMDLGAALLNPFDVNDIAEKIHMALQDKAIYDDLSQHGLKKSSRYSWNKSARLAIESWEKISKQEPESFAENGSNKKLRLAFVSPMPPERTGIADYSEILIPALSFYYDIEVITDQDQCESLWIDKHPDRVHDACWLKSNMHQIDRVVYQVGNSKFHAFMIPLMREIPGVIVLHDFYLGGIFSWLEENRLPDNAWVENLYASHGYNAVIERIRDSSAAYWKYPVNLSVLQHVRGMIVHSEYSKMLFKRWHGDDFNILTKVVPLIRLSAISSDKLNARRKLGIDEADFIVCSFGFIGESKLHHRILDCWLGSALATHVQCQLFFVGEHGNDEYGQKLLRSVHVSGFENRIHITGFLSPEIFQLYLVASDLAIQLRTNSRGETSAAVLDCMNNGLPVIVNENGSMGELDPKAVWMLPDQFEDDSLIQALQVLWENPEKRHMMGAIGRNIIHEYHAPAAVAKDYVKAIETSYKKMEVGVSALITAIAKNTGCNEIYEPDMIKLARDISVSFPLRRSFKTLYLDVTATCRNDLKTGIERVARAILIALLKSPPAGYRIEPVYLSNDGGQWHYRFARRYTLSLLECPSQVLDDEVVEPENGDVILGLDLSGETLVQADESGLFRKYRDRGIDVYFVVFDLLPVRMPKVFPPGVERIHSKWLETILSFDGAICISRSVADDLSSWREECGFYKKSCQHFQIDWFHLGADLLSSSPSRGVPDAVSRVVNEAVARPTFLMVGTIEPRKGYLQAINAFSELWRDGLDVNLIIVGHEGWTGLTDDMRRDIPKTIQCIQLHPELNKRLFWLKGISDEYLEKVYAASTCLIAASYGEGFGLPLIEAAHHGIPLIARDMPVFREVAGDHAFYFNAESETALAQEIINWIALYQKNAHPKPDGISWLSWQQSANNLMTKIIHADEFMLGLS